MTVAEFHSRVDAMTPEERDAALPGKWVVIFRDRNHRLIWRCHVEAARENAIRVARFADAMLDARKGGDQ